MGNNTHKKELKEFSDKLKEYQSVCRSIWRTSGFQRNNEEFKKLLKSEESLREKLIYEWGMLERVFRKLGINTIGIMMGR